MSTLMFWNKQNLGANYNDAKNEKKSWLHGSDALVNGHVVYLVKFFGNIQVDQPKGIEVVKDAIRRLQFAQQLKKAETGNNTQIKKVEITISVDGLTIQEPRTQKHLYQFPLHNISYCADEEGVKKFFSFIAKTTGNTGLPGETEEKHECFVFISSKLASDITLTIGQAFDLAYRRYMNDSLKMLELSKAQAQITNLESVISTYKLRLKELTKLVPQSDLNKTLARLNIRDICEIRQEHDSNEVTYPYDEHNYQGNMKNQSNLIEPQFEGITFIASIQNIQSQINQTLGTLKVNTAITEQSQQKSDSDSDFDPRADEWDNKTKKSLIEFEAQKTYGEQLFTIDSVSKKTTIDPQPALPLLAPPPKQITPRRGFLAVNSTKCEDLFGSDPFSPSATTKSNQNFKHTNQETGVNDDISIESLDPLQH